MQLDVLNTTAALLTVTIVAATAVAALVQLRHLRAGNQISALLSITETLDGKEFRDALGIINGKLDGAIVNPAFRAYVIANSRRVAMSDVDPAFTEINNAIVLVGNTFEVLGVISKNRIIDPTLLVDACCGLALGSWRRLAHFTALSREAVGDDALFEHFEYLAVLSEDWIARHPSSYPRGVRRLAIQNPWPLSSAVAS